MVVIIGVASQTQTVAGRQLTFALFRTGTPAETAVAREYLSKTGYAVLDGELPDRTTYRNASSCCLLACSPPSLPSCWQVSM